MLLIYIASLPFRQLLFVERQGFLILLGLLLIWSILRRQLWIVRTPLDLPLLAFVFWVGFTVPFASFPDYSVKEFGKLLQGVLIFYAVIFFLQPERQRNSLVYILVLMVAIVSGAGIYQFDAANYQATRSFLSSEVWLTTFLVMFIPLCWALAAFDRSTMRRPLFLSSWGFLRQLVCCLRNQGQGWSLSSWRPGSLRGYTATASSGLR
jgi:hypothetical protein